MKEAAVEFKDLSFSKSRISDQVRQVLKEAVLNLKPGDRIPSEDEMARQFKVSKVTIREALGGLEAEGLVERRRGIFGGSFVAKPSNGKMGELVMNYYRMGDVTPEDFVEFRRILEPTLAELAAERRTEADLKAMRRMIDQSERGLRGDSPRRAPHLEFHYLIADACQNAMVSHVMRALALVFNSILDQIPLTEADARQDLDYHKQLYACFVRGDGKTARDIMTAHFDTLEGLVAKWRAVPKATEKKKARKVQ